MTEAFICVDVEAAGPHPGAYSLLSIGAAVLEARIAAGAGRWDDAIALLQDAVARQDALPYTEPPPWYFPVRQVLGAELLAQGRAEEAEAVYRKDLEQYPRNGWSFFGLAESLAAQGREAQANVARAYHEEAFKGADVELEASAF